MLYLIGWGNRFGTLSLWFTKNRAHRIITLDQAIDEIGNQGSAVAGKIRSGMGRRHHRQLRRECGADAAQKIYIDAAERGCEVLPPVPRIAIGSRLWVLLTRLGSGGWSARS
ncbi:MAG: hypothetical protein JWR37_690 [Mycobacterium sp.]|nr:hypothetical protein [Mycobacterium sp.]